MFNTPNYNYSYPWSQAVAQPQPQSTGINWVQGEAGAKSYPIAPGNSVMLMDSENNVFYIKSSDSSGMPMPLRIFDYTERTQQKQANIQPNNEYITRKEFEKRLSELKNAKQPVSATQ
jgi:hypothetical protein